MLTDKKILICFLVCIILIQCTKSPVKNKIKFRCNADKIESDPITATKILPSPKNLKNKRTLDGEGNQFKDFNIYLDLVNFYNEAQLNGIDNVIIEMFVEGMTKAVNTLESLLQVKPIPSNYHFTDEEIQSYGINDWNKTIIGNTSNKGMQELDIDLFIFVRFGDSNELGETTLASAGAKSITSTGQPLIGVANINKDLNYSIENSLQYFQSTILHEFIHILGFANSFFVTFYKNNITKVDENGIIRNYLNSPKVLEVAKKYFNCNDIEGVELENYGGDGTTGSHWEERILLGDIMNGVVYPEEQVISEFTLAVLEDSGYYKANYYTGGLMQYGKNKGCNFLKNKCVVNKTSGEVNPKFKNEFFDYTLFYGNIDPSCSSGRQSRTYHYLYDFKDEEERIPSDFNYYSSGEFGGRPSADYCPVSQEDYYESQSRYFVGHCSIKGNGGYGTELIDIYKRIPGNDQLTNNGDLVSTTGEINSDHSFCVLSSLISANKQNSESYADIVNAFCYQMYCSERSLTIQINNDYLVCPRAGGKINAVNYNGFLLCPDYYLICSGKVLCNDLFDCVDKKSTLKENIDYDYEIKTSQDIYDAGGDFSTDAYELSENGKCPINCCQCDSNGNCKKCKNDYGIVEITEEDNTIRNCWPLNSLEGGYYILDSIYYKCNDNCIECNESECITCTNRYFPKNKNCFELIDNCINYDENGNCITCDDGYKIKQYNNINYCERGFEGCKIFDTVNNICTTCEDNYRKVDNNCYKEIENCNGYNGEFCSECNSEFAFNGTERDKCIDKNLFGDKYYFKENSYYFCNDQSTGGVENCEKCSYEDNKVICNQCSENYILKDEKTDECYSKSEYNTNNNYYYFVDDFHIKSCASKIVNCEKCIKEENSENIECKKCVNGYRVSKNLCFQEIENCQTYDQNDDNKCSNCNEGFVFLGDDRIHCFQVNIEEYFSTNNGESYISCNDTNNRGIENCNKCQNNNNNIECTQCQNNLVLKDNDTVNCINPENYINSKEYYFEDNYHIKKCSFPQENCKKCLKSEEDGLKCIACNDGYFLIHKETDNCESQEIFLSNDEYYQIENDFYSCLFHNSIENCKKCQNNNSCLLCNDNYAFIKDDKSICSKIEELGNHYILIDTESRIYKKCEESLQKCDTCESEDNEAICLSCLNNYGLYNDRKQCIDLSEQKHYKDSDDLYYECEVGISNCLKCSAKNACIKCKEGFVKIDGDKTNCNLFTNLNEDEYFQDKNDDNNYIKCSTYIPNCLNCNSEGCNICNTGFIMLNDDTKTCYEKNKIDLKSYFTENNITYYSCQETKYKNKLQCFSLVPQQVILLTFLQVQMVKKKLVCYMITHSPLPKDFSIKLKINVYTNRIRNLEGSGEKEVVLTANEDSNGSTNTIVSFTSNEEYKEEENVQVKELKFNDDNLVTKTVTKNNICSFKFDSTSNLVDTKKVKTMIEEKKIPDCSTGQRSNIISLNMNKVENCEFDLNSEEEVSFSNDLITIDLVEKENKEQIITAECDTTKDKTKSVKCNIKKDDKTEINNEYILKEQIVFDSEQFIAITPEEDTLKIFCKKKDSKKKLIITIVIIIVAVGIIASVVVVGVCICKKDKKIAKEKNNNNNEINEKNNVQFHKLEKIPTRRKKKKNKTTMPKLETENVFSIQETEGVINANINENEKEKKRKKSRSKTKKHTVKSRKNKKHKSTKITKHNEE